MCGTNDASDVREHGVERILLVRRAIAEIVFKLGEGRSREVFQKVSVGYVV